MWLPGRQGEIKDSNNSIKLRRIVRVGQLGGDVHPEVFMVGNDGITQLQNCFALLLKGL